MKSTSTSTGRVGFVIDLPDDKRIEDLNIEAPGAWPNGSRVRKARLDEGDLHPIGALGTVLASFPPMPEFPGAFAYFVKWDRIRILVIADVDQTALVVVNHNGRLALVEGS